MTQKENLEELLAQVEAGKKPDWLMTIDIFGSQDKVILAAKAYDNSTDAALSLHKATVGDVWRIAKIYQYGWWSLIPIREDDIWSCTLWSQTKHMEITEKNGCLGRALLICNIKALISECDK